MRYLKFLAESIHESMRQKYCDTRVDTWYTNANKAQGNQTNIAEVGWHLIVVNWNWYGSDTNHTSAILVGQWFGVVVVGKVGRIKKGEILFFFPRFVMHDTIFNLPSLCTIQARLVYRDTRVEYRTALGNRDLWRKARRQWHETATAALDWRDEWMMKWSLSAVLNLDCNGDNARHPRRERWGGKGREKYKQLLQVETSLNRCWVFFFFPFVCHYPSGWVRYMEKLFTTSQMRHAECTMTVS